VRHVKTARCVGLTYQRKFTIPAMKNFLSGCMDPKYITERMKFLHRSSVAKSTKRAGKNLVGPGK
jgi:hypothetical protein